jgi:hypothetical protein
MGRDDSHWNDRSPTAECKVCGEKSMKGADLCRRCRRFAKRVGSHADVGGRQVKVSRATRLDALWNAWHPRTGTFVCAYTGIALSDDAASRRYARWEFGTPGDESSVALISDLINRMKADMTPAEFRRLVRALARQYDGKPFDKRAFPGDQAQAA